MPRPIKHVIVFKKYPMRSKLRVRQRACIGRCTDSRCFKGNANGPLGKKGGRSPIFQLGWKCTGLRRALQVLMVQWWSFDQAAKQKSMKNKWKFNVKSSKKASKNRAKTDQKSMKIEVLRGSGRILAFKRVLGGVWAALKSEIVANMASSWLPKVS